MSESNEKATEGRPADRNPVSAVKLPVLLTASIDAWARAHGINRSDAIQRLLELALKSEATAGAKRVSRLDAAAVEQQAASQLDQFIDPDTPQEERNRRIQRLTEGPPEFVELRIDLPKHGS